MTCARAQRRGVHPARVRVAARRHRARRGGPRHPQHPSPRASASIRARCAHSGCSICSRGDLGCRRGKVRGSPVHGAQSYDALYFLGAVADAREDSERALRYYSRVAGGDFALHGAGPGRPHQGRAVRPRCRACAPRGVRPGAPAARAGRHRRAAGLASGMDDGGPRARDPRRRPRAVPDSMDLRMARVFAFERAAGPTPRSATCAGCWKTGLGCGGAERPGLHARDRNRQLEEAAALVSAAFVQMRTAPPCSTAWAGLRSGRSPEGGPRVPRACPRPRRGRGDRPASRRGAMGARRPGRRPQDLAGCAQAPAGRRATQEAPGAGRPVRRGALAILATLALSGCATSPRSPVPAVLPDRRPSRTGAPAVASPCPRRRGRRRRLRLGAARADQPAGPARPVRRRRRARRGDARLPCRGRWRRAQRRRRTPPVPSCSRASDRAALGQPALLDDGRAGPGPAGRGHGRRGRAVAGDRAGGWRIGYDAFTTATGLSLPQRFTATRATSVCG